MGLGSRQSCLASARGHSYLPDWRFDSANYDTLSQHTTHLILFSLEPTTRGGLSGLDRLPSPAVLGDARAAATRHGCRLLLCFGGNGRSGGFSEMSRSAKARKAFVANAAGLIQEMRLDGVGAHAVTHAPDAYCSACLHSKPVQLWSVTAACA